jgi:Methyltransferase domain
MRRFAKSFVIPFIVANGYKRICEIGANQGENTERLLELPTASLSIIDPCPGEELVAWCEREERVQLHRGRSLEVLPQISEPFDCILIDGDHNWYTVYHELKTIHSRALLADRGAIFFHDVGWPYGRRDMYYAPETIPSLYLHPHDQKGIVRGRSKLSSDCDFNAHHWNAIAEGGARNGVLTGIEDFMKEHPGQFRFTRIHAEYGLGVLTRRKSGPRLSAYSKLLAKSKYLGTMGSIRSQLRERSPALLRTLAKARDLYRQPKKTS